MTARVAERGRAAGGRPGRGPVFLFTQTVSSEAPLGDLPRVFAMSRRPHRRNPGTRRTVSLCASSPARGCGVCSLGDIRQVPAGSPPALHPCTAEAGRTPLWFRPRDTRARTPVGWAVEGLAGRPFKVRLGWGTFVGHSGQVAEDGPRSPPGSPTRGRLR